MFPLYKIAKSNQGENDVRMPTVGLIKEYQSARCLHCPYCYSFKTNNQKKLENHVQKCPWRAFPCPFCAKHVFFIRNHVKKWHSYFKCPECEKGFPSAAERSLHKNIHEYHQYSYYNYFVIIFHCVISILFIYFILFPFILFPFISFYFIILYFV